MVKFLFGLMIVVMFCTGVCFAEQQSQGDPITAIGEIKDAIKQLPGNVSEFEKTSYGHLFWWLLFWQFFLKDALVGAFMMFFAAGACYLLYHGLKVDTNEIK